LLRHSVYNLLGLGLPLLAALVAIPGLIESLGTERFGILTLIWALVSYFGLFDLGLGRALTQQLAASWARGEVARGERLIAAALAGTAALGLVAGIVLAAGAVWLVRHLDGVSNPGETVAAIYWMAVALPLVIVTSALRGVLEARGAFGLLNLVRLPLGLYTFLAPLAVVHYWHNDLAAIALVLMLGRAAAFLAHLALCFGSGSFSLPMRRPDGATLGELLRSGGWMTVSNVISPLMGYLDRFVIGLTVSMSAVAYYATPYEIVTKLWIIPAALTAVLFPRFARVAVERSGEAANLFRHGVLLLFVVLFPVTLGVALFARELLELWLGADFASHSYVPLQVFALGILINCLAHVPFTFLQAVGRAKTVATIHLAEFPVFLLLLWTAAKTMGLQGAVLAWLLRMIADSALLFSFASRMRRRTEWRSGMRISTLLLLASVSFAALYIESAGPRLLAGIGGAALVYLYCWALVLEPAERLALRRGVGYVSG
jgi:O-antigen/teichoic acid export membrane protein